MPPTMTPNEIRHATIGALESAFLDMCSPRWDLALVGEPEPEVARAARTLLAVQRARVRMENAKLGALTERLKENEGDLLAGRKELEKSLENLEEVPAVLDAAGRFLDVVSRIVGVTL